MAEGGNGAVPPAEDTIMPEFEDPRNDDEKNHDETPLVDQDEEQQRRVFLLLPSISSSEENAKEDNEAEEEGEIDAMALALNLWLLSFESLDTIPVEVLSEITSYLDSSSDVLSILLTCHSLHDTFCRCEYSYFPNVSFPVTAEMHNHGNTFRETQKAFPFVEDVTLEYCCVGIDGSSPTLQLLMTGERFPNLRRLRYRSLEKENFNRILDTHLGVGRWYADVETPEKVAKMSVEHPPLVQFLELLGSCSGIAEQLEVLDFGDWFVGVTRNECFERYRLFELFRLWFPRLESFRYGGCFRARERSHQCRLLMLAKSIPAQEKNLRLRSLDGFSFSSWHELADVFRLAPELEEVTVEFSGVPDFGRLAVRGFPPLRKLFFRLWRTDLPRIDQTFVNHILTRFPLLESLILIQTKANRRIANWIPAIDDPPTLIFKQKNSWIHPQLRRLALKIDAELSLCGLVRCLPNLEVFRSGRVRMIEDLDSPHESLRVLDVGWACISLTCLLLCFPNLKEFGGSAMVEIERATEAAQRVDSNTNLRVFHSRSQKTLQPEGIGGLLKLCFPNLRTLLLKKNFHWPQNCILPRNLRVLSHLSIDGRVVETLADLQKLDTLGLCVHCPLCFKDFRSRSFVLLMLRELRISTKKSCVTSVVLLWRIIIPFLNCCPNLGTLEVVGNVAKSMEGVEILLEKPRMRQLSLRENPSLLPTTVLLLVQAMPNLEFLEATNLDVTQADWDLFPPRLDLKSLICGFQMLNLSTLDLPLLSRWILSLESLVLRPLWPGVEERSAHTLTTEIEFPRVSSPISTRLKNIRIDGGTMTGSTLEKIILAFPRIASICGERMFLPEFAAFRGSRFIRELGFKEVVFAAFSPQCFEDFLEVFPNLVYMSLRGPFEEPLVQIVEEKRRVDERHIEWRMLESQV